MKKTKKSFSMNEDSDALDNDIILVELEEKDQENSNSYIVDEVVQGLSGAKLGAQVYLVDIHQLEPYPNQPFKQYSVERLQELAEDISRVGILSPILTRKFKNKLQILAGHNRWAAAKIAGLSHVPIMVLEVDDDQAILVLTSTNLRQREMLLPSEKAFAYKMQMEALKRQGKRSENSSENTLAANLITEQTGDSRMQIHRFIRLTELDSGLLELLDKNKISMTPAVAISYLVKENQQEVFMLIKEYGATLSIDRANLLKNKAMQSKDYTLSLQDIELVLLKTSKNNQDFILKLNYNKILQYIPKNTPKEDVEEIIIEALKVFTANN